MKSMLSLVLLFAVHSFADEICKAGPMYGYCGGIAPDRWASLSPAWSACNGPSPQQSPMRIPQVRRLNSDLGPLVMHYQAMPLTVTNTSHAIKIPAPGGDVEEYFELGQGARKVRFELEEFHFHVPAEHTVQPYNSNPVGELHLVHRAPDGSSAAIGILLVASQTDNDALRPIITAIPQTPLCGAHVAGKLDLPALVGVSAPTNFSSYAGSLTTPNCSAVRWFLMPFAIPISETQRKALNIFGGNARPLQNGNTMVYCWPASGNCRATGD